MTRQTILLVCILFGSSGANAPIYAQNSTPTPVVAPAPIAEPPTVAELEARIAALDTADGLDQTTRESIASIYREAIEALKRRDDANARRAESERVTAAAPAMLASIRAELADPPAQPALNTPDNPPLSIVEPGLVQAQAVLTAARADAELLAAEAAHRDERRPAIAAQVADLRKRLTETTEAIAALATAEPSQTSEAQTARLLARRAYLVAEIDAIEKEGVSYTARVDLLPARRDLATRRITEAQRVVDAWQVLVSKAQQVEADQAVTRARELEQRAAEHRVLREFADQSTRLANLRVGTTGTAARDAELESRLQAVEKELEKLRTGYESVQARIRASDFNRATGLLLTLQYANLPEPQSMRRELATLQSRLERAELDFIDFDEQRKAAGDINSVVEELLEQIQASDDPPAAERDVLEAVAEDLATNRLDTLDSLKIDTAKEIRALRALTDAVTVRNQAVSEYRAYIEERILWIRSIDDKNLKFIPELAKATAWLVNPAQWRTTLDTTLQQAKSRPTTSIAAICLVILTYLLRRIAARRLVRLSKLVANYKTDSLTLTLKALGHTFLASTFLTSLFMVVGWFLRTPPSQTPLGIAVGEALTASTTLVFVLSFSRAALRNRGLFASHFRWPAAAVAHLRRELRWFMPVVIPVVVLTHTFEIYSDDRMIATLGRIAFSVHMIALAILVRDVLRPRGPTMSEYLRRTKSRILNSARYVWYILAIVLPLGLAAVSWLGYHYTAIQLFTQVQYTLFLITTLIIAYALMLRWLFVTRRDVAIKEARRRRDQAKPEEGADPPPPVDEDRLDLPAISAQTQKLFGVTMVVAAIIGLLSIWSSVLPALRMLEKVEVLPVARIVGATEDKGIPILERPLTQAAQPAKKTPETTTPDTTPPANNNTKPAASAAPGSPLQSMGSMLNSPQDSPEPEQDAQPEPERTVVTLADIGLAIIILVATFLAFRDLPGLVEILIFSRLPLDAGIRYALSTIFRYFIAIIGILVAFSVLGVTWSKVQWLAAALTFGLAFGLQEIFANFVSGVIILLERPVRIGDTVTIGTTTGDISRIRMRATTITDWERKELIIPNKTFITGDVINWSLTDPVLRVTIPVGVSYGSDVDQVVRVLTKIAADSKVVLKDPPPVVLFGGFGDSTLDFQLRVFIPSIRSFVEVRHAMHMNIMKTFRAEGIEIAFPQRDLHIRSADAELLIKNASPNEPTIEPAPPKS